MPYQLPDGTTISDGLYVVEAINPQKLVRHFGVLDIGGILGLPEVDAWRPVVVHQTQPQIQWQWLDLTGSNWTILGKIEDEDEARARLNESALNPRYDLFGNNCEHFANFMAIGQRLSPQVSNGLAIVAAAIGVYALVKVTEKA